LTPLGCLEIKMAKYPNVGISEEELEYELLKEIENRSYVDEISDIYRKGLLNTLKGIKTSKKIPSQKLIEIVSKDLSECYNKMVISRSASERFFCLIDLYKKYFPESALINDTVDEKIKEQKNLENKQQEIFSSIIENFITLALKK